MSKIAFIDLAQMLADAGFPNGTSQLDGVAIVCAESGRDPAAQHVNADGSVDRGLWQINSVAHPEVTDTEAYDPVLATAAAFRISNSGTDYGPWSTYGNGAYKTHLEAAGVSLAGALLARKLSAAQANNTTLKQQNADLMQQNTTLQQELDAANQKISNAKADLA